MDIIGIILLAVGVSMDAFAVSICKGTTIKKDLNKKSLIVGSWFGIFQGLMPLIGFLLMDSVNQYLNGFKEYIIFALLSYIGIVMIIESKKKDTFDDSLKIKEMFLLSIATSLDALSIGASLSLLETNIFGAVTIIAFITFLFCYFGVKIGSKFGDKYKAKAEITGGIILICLGIKILLQYFI